MGTGASSNVKPVSIEQNEEESSADQRHDRPWSSVSAMLRQRNHKKKNNNDDDVEELKLLLLQSKALISEEKEKTTKAEDRVRALEEQVAALESSRLDLDEHIQILEEKLEELHVNQSAAHTSDDFTKTLQSKDDTISRLEKHMQEQEAETHRLKMRHKKKVKSLHAQLAETRHELSLQMFEMRSEMEQLSEQNSDLKAKIPEDEGSSKTNNPDSFFLTERCHSSMGGNEENRNRIILELSERVSEQEEEIENLKKFIKEQKEELKRAKTTKLLNKTSVAPDKNTKREENLYKDPESPVQPVLSPQPPGGDKKARPGPTNQRLRSYKQTKLKSPNNVDTKPDSLSMHKTGKIDSDVTDEMKLIASEMRKLQGQSSNSSYVSIDPLENRGTVTNGFSAKDANSNKIATGWLDEEDFHLPVVSPICTH